MKYETKPCPRCGGSGHYSYNQMTGTRCFQCGGAKTVLSRAGLKARAFATSILEVPIEDLPEGRRAVYRCAFDGKKVVFSSVTRREDVMAYRVLPDGSREPIFGYRLNPSATVISAGIRVRMIPTPEEEARILEVQQNA